MSRLFILAAFLGVPFSSMGADGVIKHSIWCDSRGSSNPKTYMITMKFEYDRARNSCVVTEGDSLEYGVSFTHTFSCSVNRIERREDSLLSIQLESLEHTGSGDEGRAAQTAAFFYDVSTKFGKGMARLRDSSLIPLTCITGP